MSAYVKYRIEARSRGDWEFYARTDNYARAIHYFDMAKAAPTTPSVRLIEVDQHGAETVIVSHAQARRSRKAA